ncbi:MAG: type II toxin-antitoxin system RelE/ParE family toxin [Rickettsiales bacterium]
MSKKYRITATAARKLDFEIGLSRDRYGARHAAAYKAGLLAAVRKISQNPKICVERPEIGKGVRCARFKGNYIVYRLSEDGAEVIVLNFPGVREERMV